MKSPSWTGRSWEVVCEDRANGCRVQRPVGIRTFRLGETDQMWPDSTDLTGHGTVVHKAEISAPQTTRHFEKYMSVVPLTILLIH